MSNVCNNVVLEIFNHIYRTGDNIMNKEKRKNYKVTFIPDDSGKSLKVILEQSFKEKMSSEKLIENENDDLQKSKIGDNICM